MLIILPVLLGIALALARGGSLRNLAMLRFRGVGAIMASFLIQLVTYVPPMRDTALVRQHGEAIYIGVLALMLLGVARNWRLGLSARLIFLGLTINTVVVVANGGHMPVNAAALRAAEGPAVVRVIAAHQKYPSRMLADRSSVLLPFSDILPISLPVGFGFVGSLGDLFIAFGGATLADSAARRPGRGDADTSEPGIRGVRGSLSGRGDQPAAASLGAPGTAEVA
jgi:hypothetical protein